METEKVYNVFDKNGKQEEGVAVLIRQEDGIVPLIFKKSQIVEVDEVYFKVELTVEQLQKLIKQNQALLDRWSMTPEEKTAFFEKFANNVKNGNKSIGDSHD